MKIRIIITILMTTLLLAACGQSNNYIETITDNNTEVSQSQIATESAQDNNIPTQEPSTESIPSKNLPVSDGSTADITIPNKATDIVHINETLKGSQITLNINLDVVDYPDAEFGVYDTDLVDIDFDEWLEYFFPDTPKEELLHLYGDKNKQTSDDRKKLGIGEDYLNTSFSFIDSDNGDEDMIVGVYDKASKWNFNYLNNQITVGKGIRPEVGYFGHLTHQKQDFDLSDSEKLQSAEKLTDELFSFAFKDAFTNNFVMSLSGAVNVPDEYNKMNDTNNFYDIYVVLYDRYIEGLPVLFDDLEQKSSYHDFRRPDMLEAFIYEDEVFLARGCIRDLTLSQQSKVISANDALSILKKQFETGRINGEFDINRFELMYFTYYTDDAEKLTAPKGGGGAYAKYIPVWVIASGYRISPNSAQPAQEYALIIDAITGELVTRLPK